MSNELLASKIVVSETPPSTRTIAGVPTAVLAQVGITEKGPVGLAVRVTSYSAWVGVFGGDIAAGVAAVAVRGFFENGGNELWFTRTVHYTDINNAASKISAAATLNLKTPVTAATAGSILGSVVGPFAFNPGDILRVAVDGAGAANAVFDAAAASRTAANTETYVLVDGTRIEVAVDGGAPQVIEFLDAEFTAIALATSLEVAAVINAKLVGASCDGSGSAPVITSDTKGTDSNIVVSAGTPDANAILGFPTASTPVGTGDVADISQVSVAEIKAVAELDISGLTINDVGGAVQIVSNTTGAGSSIAVDAASDVDTELGLDNATHSGGTGAAVDSLQVDAKYDGVYGNGITTLITNATSDPSAGPPSTGDFNLAVLAGGVVVEVWPNGTMDDAVDDYIVDRVNDPDNGSRYIQLVNLDANPNDSDLERPANSPGSPPVAFGPLTGGDDGLAGIADIDYIGSSVSKTGIRSFDTIQDIRLLICPDQPTSQVHNALVVYCEVTRDLSMFTILDPPAGLNRDAIVTYVTATAALLNLSEFGMISWPHVKVVNPSSAVFGNGSTITVPPSGHIAGMFARTDGQRPGGVYQPPAGVERGVLFGVTGFETDEVLEEGNRDVIYPKRINPITAHPGHPIALDGVRTLKGGGNFATIAERRGVIFIEQSIKNGLQFARLSNNDEFLRAKVERTITAFLTIQMKQGAFRSKEADKAFFVDVSEALNPPTEIFAGKLNVRIGLATQKPAEFIVLEFTQDTRALDEELAS